MTINMTLRLPDHLATRLDEIAAETGNSRHALIISILDQHTQRDDDISPDWILGFIGLTGGKLDIDCPECFQPMTQPHIGFIAGVHQPQPFGPICSLCAQT